jgi:hypothetical protein
MYGIGFANLQQVFCNIVIGYAGERRARRRD